MTKIRRAAPELDHLGEHTDRTRGATSPSDVMTRSHCSPGTIEPLLESTVGSALEAAAERWADAIALVAASASRSELCRWTFADLDRTARAVAWSLLARFHPGDRIAVWAPNVAEHFLVDLGAALAGLTVVPIPLAVRSRELHHLLGQSGSSGLFLVPDHRGVEMAGVAAQVDRDLPALREIIDLTCWSEILSAGSSNEPLPFVAPSDPAQLMFTSGSTGLPKGALLHHHGITNASRFVAAGMGVGAGDVWLNFMPLSYVAGSSIAALAALQAGATQVLTDFEPAVVLRLVATEGCSAMLAGVSMYRMLLEHPTMADSDVSSLRVVASGGSTIPPDLARRIEEAFGATLTVVYGLTEVCGIALQTTINDTPTDRLASIGLPLPHMEAKVADPQSGSVLALGEPGELCLRGYQLMDGYLDLPEATAEAIAPDGWLHTGDLATMDKRGYVRITGRLKEIINRGGRKIAPAEIETVLQTHPAVSTAAAVGVPDERMGEEIAVFVKLIPGGSVDEEELAALCRAELAPYKKPRYWVFVDELPTTSSGKVQKFRLRERFLAEAASQP
jgi:fatty-acyl-CoA synthase